MKQIFKKNTFVQTYEFWNQYFIDENRNTKTKKRNTLKKEISELQDVAAHLAEQLEQQNKHFAWHLGERYFRSDLANLRHEIEMNEIFFQTL